ncbi:uncharacterized protein [Branchiostoma lanceolatum]|uniref:uncharacterized protein n=1 Tax=Branchiostoma lanceolatum TaxID=7740 RepID=UPI0034524EF8
MACRKEDPTVEINGELDEEQQKILKSLADAPGGAKTELLKKIQEYATKNMEAWKDQKVKVGIVGDPGAGKSTFINSIRGLKPKQKDSAMVGVTHTTSEATDYPHPKNPSLVFVDFPGVLLKKGTSDKRAFNIQQYLDEFGEKMEQCQLFLVFSSGRIQRNALQIGMKARDMGEKVLFVRSQFDIDLADKKEDDPDYFEGKGEEEAVANLMEELRKDYIKVLKDVGWEGEVNPRDVFIISGRYDSVLKGRWDIPKFREEMFDGLGALQKMVVIHTCRDFSKNTIKERGDVLRSQMEFIALAATRGTFVPIVGAVAVPRALSSAYENYKEAFDLTEDAVEQLAKMTKKSPQDLKREINGELDEEQRKILKNLADAPGGAKTELLKKIQEYAIKNMEAWKDQKVKVGIVGERGAGKGTFINSIRGLRPTQEGAAKVGIGHTSSEATEYPHPKRSGSLVFVDFPGVPLKKGTGKECDFDIQQYLDEFGEKMEACHLFLVFSSGLIHHNALLIGMKARDMGKKVLFVRSKFDKDLSDKRNDDPDYFEGKEEEEAVANLIEELRKDYIDVLKEVGWEGEVRSSDVFIISCRLEYVLKGSWDIPKFKKAMFDGLGALMKMVVINTCRDFSKNTIKERGDVLRSQMEFIALAATRGTFVLIVGAVAVPRALSSAYENYKEAFDLTEDAVEQLAKMTKKSPQDLKRFVSSRLLAGAENIKRDEALAVVMAICRELGLETSFGEFATTFYIPIIGAAFNASSNQERMLKVLDALISRMQKCASDLFDYAFK